jgi:cytoplasmic iron level regulating protein YaaA (DUF328/UPF0246 family)
MLVVVSPAKKLNMQPVDNIEPTRPLFGQDANELAGVMQGLGVAKVKSLMGLSHNLAQLNADRFIRFGSQEKKPAALAFAGGTYQGLEAETFEPEEMAWAQNHLRILSGLYGVLRPLDEIEPYRLEMRTRLETARGKSLYQYWGSKLSDALNKQAEATKSILLVNCASKEYFGAVDLASLTLPVVTPIFMEEKNGTSKIVSFYAKKARGAIACFIMQNRLTDCKDLKEFDSGGYCYQADRSDADNLVFIRSSV